MAKRPDNKEPSYQIGIPLDAADDSALQRGDRYDQEETAQDYVAPPQVEHPSTEVALPQDFEQDPAEAEPAPMPMPTTEVALPPQPRRPRAAPAAAVPPRAPRAATASDRPAPRAATASDRPAPRAATASDRPAASTRSSRRTAAVSGRAPASSRRFAVDRGSWQRSLLWVGLGLLLAAVAVCVVIVLSVRESGDRRLATEAMAEAGRQVELARTALVNRRGAEARKAYEAAFATLTKTPQLGGAVPMPPDEKPVVKDLALQAGALRGEIEPLAARIAALEAENAAESNMATLKAKCATIGDPATDLDQIEREIKAFIDNPVDPRAGPSAANAATFARLVADANLRLPAIATERDRRKAARTAIPLRLAAGEVDGFIQQERFGDALARLDVVAREHPDADFAPLRARVEDAAAKAWRSAKSQFETRLADWKSPGATEGQRKVGLAAAKDRLNLVIQRFGMPLYVDQARALLAPLP